MLRNVLASLTLLSCTVASAADWPQWRGPNRDGKSAEKGLMVGFPADGPKLLWSVEELEKIGTGYGTPAIVGGKLYIVGANGAKQDAKEFVSCLDVATGTAVWQTPLDLTPGRFLDMWGGGTRSTPTVDGDHVYVLGATGDLVCLKTSDGAKVWKKNLVKDFGGGIPQWGYSESVLVDGDVVVATPGKDTLVVALNKKTGETVWKCTDLKDDAGYASLIPATIGGIKQYITQTGAHAIGIDAKSGKLLWNVGEIKRRTAVIPTPVVTGNQAFFTSGYGAGCELVNIEGKSAKVVYKNSLVANHHGGVIEHNGKLYGHSDAKSWFCYDYLKGAEDLIWTSNKLDKGSITFADGQFYCYSQSNGTLVTIKAVETGWTETGRFKIPGLSAVRPKQGQVWAHPVISGGKLFLRDYEKLFVYDIGGKAAE
jgi:outer membrane protein assembly factor BamB